MMHVLVKTMTLGKDCEYKLDRKISIQTDK